MTLPTPGVSGTTVARGLEPDHARRPDIQGLRAIAVLMVVAFHAGFPVPGGFVGVDVFFVISGFVITAMLHREWLTSGRIRFMRFYARRFKRLTPALSLVVSVTVVMSFALLSPFGPQQDAALTGIGAMIFGANFVIARFAGGYFDSSAEMNPLLNTWSLSVEEQFYLVFPAILAVGWLLSQRHRWLRFSPLWLVFAVATVSFALAVIGSMGLTFRGSDTILGFYSPFTRAWEFALGALLALVLPHIKSMSPQLVKLMGVFGAGLLAASLFLISGETPFPGVWTLLPVTGTLFLLVSGTNTQSLSARLLSVRPMTKVGDWSYSIYLWHWPLIVFAIYLWPDVIWAAPVAAAVSFIPAITSYRWLEQPIRNLPALSTKKTSGLVAAVMVPPLLLSAIVGWTAANWLRPNFESGSFSIIHSGDVGLDKTFGYLNRTFYPCTPEDIRVHAEYWEDFLRCQQSQPQGPVEVAIIGDSHAEHLFLGLAEAAPGKNVAYYIYSDTLPIRSASKDMARVLDYVSSNTDIRTVIVNNSWSIHKSFEGELQETLERLVGSGKNVFITDDIPNFPFPVHQCIARVALLVSNVRCNISRLEADATYSQYIETLRKVVRAEPEVNLLETYKYFCSTNKCSMLNGSELLYGDSDHLNMNGSRFLAKKLFTENPELSEALR